MRFAVVMLIVAFVPVTAAAQSPSAGDERVKEDIRTLFRELNAAAQRKDRAALERLHAPEFLFIHGLGYIDTLQTRLDGIVGADTLRELDAPDFDPPNEFHVYGDVAILRSRNSRDAGPSTLGTSIYSRRDGRWRLLQVQTTRLQPPRQAIAVSIDVLDTFVGRYDSGSGGVTAVSREGDVLVVRHPAFPTRRLTPIGASQFADVVGGEWTFVRGADGKVSHLLLRSGPQQIRAMKVE